MQRIKIPINSFEFGELSPAFTSRVDTELYQKSASKITNFVILGEGGVKKRSGSSKIHKFNTTVGSERLHLRVEPFVFSDDEQYILAFSNQKLEIFFVNPTTKALSLIQTITTDVDSAALPWTTDYLEQFTFTTNADFIFVCHPRFVPRTIVRTGLTTFEVSNFEFNTSADGTKIQQPYHDFQVLGTTITPSAISGAGVTLTTSANYFTPDHVGTFLLVHEAHCEITAYTSPTQVTATVFGVIRQQLGFDAFQTIAGSNRVIATHPHHGLSSGASITISRADGVGGLSANQINGTRTIAEVINENTYEFTAGSTASQTEIGGGAPRIASAASTYEWFEQSYSEVRGYPSAVTFHENRLWFGGTPAQPDYLWASASGEYFNFDVGTGLDTDSIELSGGFGAFSQVRHLVSNRDLQVFGNTSESFVPALTERPITPSNAQVKRQTPFGCGYMAPQPFDGTTVYLQANGKMVGAYVYNDAELAYNTSNIAVTASHLVKNPIQSAVVQGGFNRPESYIFFINPDGTVSVFYSLRSERKAGWSEWTTNGEFHSVCVINQRLFFVTVRDDGSGTDAYFLEEILLDMPMDFCDEYTGTAGVFDVSADFADGAVVKVVSGTDYLGEYTVSGGEVDVSSVKEVTSAYIGYQFNLELTTLPIDAQLPSGFMTGDPRHISMVTLDLVDSLSASVNGKNMVIRSVTDDFSEARPRFNGRKEFRLLGYNKDAKVTISQDVPFDLQVNGMSIEVIV